ncbi:MAG TPA: peptidoglycan DD-metalloendopeptidase family protein [Candidatus Sulfotelmatobacter sp.]|jgi:murein DD-endopeptidase MepM/ murein hydrolase activator NlpD|nr:peptidoglycan DD-metalloendopeptidase family protein [Candidatus Sulfotelmatobacter sp.]
MRFPKSTALRLLLVGGFVAIGAVSMTAGYKLTHRAHGPLPADPLAAAAPDLEPELQRQASGHPVSDAQTEEESSHPIQTVVAASSGDTLLDLLIKAGVDKSEAQKAVEALGEVYNPRALKVGQEVTVNFVRPADRIGSGPFDGLALQADPARQVIAKRSGDGYSASEVKREVTRQLAHFNGTIKGSLFETAQSQGVPASVLAEMIRAFSYDVDFQRDIQPGDKFEVMFERLIDKKGQVVREGDILYANLTLSGEAMPIYRYTDSSGNPDYYNPKGESVRKALLRTPVDGAKITSGFGMRMHPILGFTKMHKGVDFSVRTGTPVMAAGSGVVDYAGAFGAYGYYVRIKHDASHSTAYAHLSRFAQGIRVGKRVQQGQTIAFSGATGRATGPHLHYEVLVNNAQVNPMSVKFQSGNKLTGAELARFQNATKQSNGWLAQTPSNNKLALNRATP